jgi:small subunit ribosomal protein S11
MFLNFSTSLKSIMPSLQTNSQFKITKNLKFKKTFTKEHTSNAIKSPILIQGIIYVKSSLNNTIITLTDLLGNTKAWVSCGSIGFKGAKRSSRFAGQAAAEQLGIKAKALGYTKVILHLKGLGKSRNVCVKGFKKSDLQIYFIKEATPLAYNGCRPSKLRRL